MPPKDADSTTKGTKRTALKDMGLLKTTTISQQLSEAAIYNKLLYSFPDMLHSNVHPPCIYIRATSTSQLTKADLPAVLTNMAGGSL